MDATDLAQEIAETGEDDARTSKREREVGIYISALAVLLAITSLGGSNAGKDTLTNAVASSDTYAFFQAKAIRQQNYTLAVRDMELRLATEPALTEAQRQAITRQIGAYRQEIDHLESDPEKKEGKRELLERARAYEAARDLGSARDPYFDLAEAGLQIAVILASTALVVRQSGPLLWTSRLLALAGTLLMINGYTLWFDLF